MVQLTAFWSPTALAANGLILLQLLGALGVGGVLGYERSFHGRAAGLRTYAVVCLAATLLTSVGGFPAQWYGGLPPTPAAADPTRIIQGIVTGIGFVGAGVIMREGFTIRGLSTAASIWLTAAIGVTIGLGFYLAAIGATLLTILVMAALRSLETALPHHRILHLSLIYARRRALPAAQVVEFIHRHGYTVVELACQLVHDGARFEYDLVLASIGGDGFQALLDNLSKSEDLLEFHLSPSRD